MTEIDRRTALKLVAAGTGAWALTPFVVSAQIPSQPFNAEFPNLESLTTGSGWERGMAVANSDNNSKTKTKAKPKPTGGGQSPAPAMDVPREQVVAFAIYTQQGGVLKMSAQLFPLKPGESREARLEFKRDAGWLEVAKAEVLYPGWDAHFRVENWDATQDVPYRVRHGERAMFEGIVRRDPIEKDVIVVGNLSCNSSRPTGQRPESIDNLKRQDPDLLFFAGDQTYRHTEHTAGWIEFGLQFREIMRDRPTICIPDDHDVGHGNVWGECGKRSRISGDADGGYRYPVEYVNQVQRQQSWHLPDPVDPAPVERGITVYFTRRTLGGIDFAILEDRKFKSGPLGKIPQMGPRPDHINDPKYDPKSIDLPGPNPVPNSPLPWTGDYHDGLGNKISMLAYANPPDITQEKQRADGYGIARFDKRTRTVTFECWPRFSDSSQGNKAQFPGWPITIAMDANDGRTVTGWLPALIFEGDARPVVQVIEEATHEIVYTVRAPGNRFHPRVYRPGRHTVKIGRHRPDAITIAGLEPQTKDAAGQRNVKL